MVTVFTMWSIHLILSCMLWPAIHGQLSCVPRTNSSLFPSNFVFSAATAAYQVEGAYNTDGRTDSIWDYLTHNNPTHIADNSTGDDACKSYELWERDIEMVRELGLGAYRFSLSWPRILPDAPSTTVNQLGVDYYNKIIDALVSYNISAYVTIYHWDLPVNLQKLGGWTNPVIIDYYVEFARTVFDLFGDRVKVWATFNEMKQMCLFGYGRTTHAPQINYTGVAEYRCLRNVMLAHAAAYHLYDDTFRANQSGIVGVVQHTQWYQNETDSDDDVQAAKDAASMENKLYLDPIFSETGGWPTLAKELIANRSLEQGYTSSRLPDWSDEEIAYIQGTSDYLGINLYTSYIVSRASTNNVTYESPSYYDDMDAVLTAWPSTWEQDNYWSLYQLFLELGSDYPNYPIYIMENGRATDYNNTLYDTTRVDLIRRVLTSVLDAINEGVDIRAYTVWSLMDNFSWIYGYTRSFGLYQVDFNDDNRTRTARTSGHVFKHIIQNRYIDWDYEPADNTTMSIES